MRVSPSTVVEAYDRLAAEGVIRSRPGSGFYVVGRHAAARAGRSRAAARPRDRSVLGVAAVARCRRRRCCKPGCGWLPADWMPNAAIRRAIRALAQRRRCRARGLRQHARLARIAPAAGPPVRRRGDRGGRRPDPADPVGHAGDRPRLPLPAATPATRSWSTTPATSISRRCCAPIGSKIVGVPYTPSGPDVARFAAALDGASAAPLHHQFRAPQSDRRDDLTADRAQDPHCGGGARPHHRRGRDLRRLRAGAVAAPRRARRARPRDPDRQLLQNAVRLDPLRLHRGPAGLDRGAGRSPGGDELRRAEPGRGRAGVRRP